MKTPNDFANVEDFGRYLRDRCRPGMMIDDDGAERPIRMAEAAAIISAGKRDRTLQPPDIIATAQAAARWSMINASATRHRRTPR